MDVLFGAIFPTELISTVKATSDNLKSGIENTTSAGLNGIKDGLQKTSSVGLSTVKSLNPIPIPDARLTRAHSQPATPIKRDLQKQQVGATLSDPLQVKGNFPSQRSSSLGTEPKVDPLTIKENFPSRRKQLVKSEPATESPDIIVSNEHRQSTRVNHHRSHSVNCAVSRTDLDYERFIESYKTGSIDSESYLRVEDHSTLNPSKLSHQPLSRSLSSSPTPSSREFLYPSSRDQRPRSPTRLSCRSNGSSSGQYSPKRDQYSSSSDPYASNRDSYSSNRDPHASNRDSYSSNRNSHSVSNRDSYSSNRHSSNRNSQGRDAYNSNKDAYSSNRDSSNRHSSNRDPHTSIRESYSREFYSSNKDYNNDSYTSYSNRDSYSYKRESYREGQASESRDSYSNNRNSQSSYRDSYKHSRDLNDVSSDHSSFLSSRDIYPQNSDLYISSHSTANRSKSLDGRDHSSITGNRGHTVIKNEPNSKFVRPVTECSYSPRHVGKPTTYPTGRSTNLGLHCEMNMFHPKLQPHRLNPDDDRGSVIGSYMDSTDGRARSLVSPSLSTDGLVSDPSYSRRRDRLSRNRSCDRDSLPDDFEDFDSGLSTLRDTNELDSEISSLDGDSHYDRVGRTRYGNEFTYTETETEVPESHDEFETEIEMDHSSSRTPSRPLSACSRSSLRSMKSRNTRRQLPSLPTKQQQR